MDIEITPPLSSTADEAAIRAIVTNVENAFNENDAERLVRDVAEDARVVSAMGQELVGREHIAAAARDGFSRPFLRDATAHYRVHDIAVLAPDVAVAHKRAWSTEAAAESGEAPEMTALYVFVRRAGRWWIIRRQNTLVPAA